MHLRGPPWPTAKGALYKIVQANLQRKRLATEEILIEATKRKVAIALLQEPYVGEAKKMRDHYGVRVFQCTEGGEGVVRAAIVVFDESLDIIQHPQLTTKDIVVVGVQTSAWKITLVSYYFDGSVPISPDLERLVMIADKLGPTRLLVGGDANSKSTWWGSRTIDNRGEDMVGTLDELGLQVLNTGNIPTFDTIRGGKRYQSHVDVTACSTDMLNLVEDWRVEENLVSSDHNGITFNIKLHKSKGTHITRTTRIYNTKKVNWAQFHAKLDQFKTEQQLTHTEIEHINNTEQIEATVDSYTKAITQTCTHTIPRKKHKQILTMPWWSEELTRLKKEVTTRKRRIRCAAPIRRAKVVEEYLKKKEEYELEARKAKIKSWKEFCGKQDREGVWEGIYRVIGRTKKREEDVPLQVNGTVLDSKGSVKVLAETFYPNDDEGNDNEEHRKIRIAAEKANDGEHDNLCDPPFTQTELLLAINTFNPKKAPGADGFTADICREAVRNDPDLFLKIINKCLEHSLFPSSWKEATVIVLRKPGKDTYSTPKSYRPIGLLPVLGKIFEKMLIARIKHYLLPKMSTRQYGFMPQKSTEDSLYTLMKHVNTKLDQKRMVTIVSLDIEGAFDSAWWPAIRVRLAEEKCPVNLRRVIDSYLHNRRVRVRYLGEEYLRKTEKGCVQGSIGGPILWNLLLDPLLKQLDKRGDYVQAFADDIVLVFDGETAQEIQRRANDALGHVWAWGKRNKLKFAPQKTVAMLVTRKLKHDTPRLSMNGISIGMSKEIKLLGLTIDDKLTFNTHAANVCRKALNFYKQLSRAARVEWGLQPEIIKTIYIAVVEPTILYAASAWAPATSKKGIRKQFDAVQRGFAQKMVKAYKTVSLSSALLLAGLLPLDIRVREAALLFEIRKGYTRRVIGDRDMERPVPITDMPHPAQRQGLEFTCLADGAALERQNNSGLRIFTDGSKIQGKVGAALSIWNSTGEIKARKLKLSECCSVYQAELLALAEATEEAVKNSAPSCSIYCDSRSALDTVANSASPHPLAVQIRSNMQILTKQNKILRLFWIKAHAGMEGNERADELAKSAALHKKSRPNYDRCPVSFVKRHIREESIEEWNRRYCEGQTAATTKVFFPCATQAYRLIKKIKLDSKIVQLLTGHGGFSSYLYRFKCKESPSCICDPAVEESALHIIVDCPVYAKQRFDIENKIDMDIKTENICKILIDKYIREEFLDYCRNIVNKVVTRNK